MASQSTRKLALLLFVLCLLPAAPRAQVREEAERPKVFCEPSRAVALVGEQLSEAKAFDDTVKRISVMTRAAGMLWPREQAQARAVFTEAFELASRHYRERGDEMREEQKRPDSPVRGLLVQLPDQRFVVLRAIAARDAAWARELSARAAEETREEAKKNDAASRERHRPAGEKLLGFAEALLVSDRQTALAVARSSFADPASMFLPNFLYKLAESDRAAADAFYREALAAYAERDLNSLLYLSLYPFGLTAAIAPVTPNTYGRRPAGFTASPEVQRLFVGVFLNFAGRRLAALTEQPPAEVPPYRQTEPEVIYAALKTLEALYGAGQPAAAERITALQGQAVTLLSPARQRSATGYSQRDLDGSDAAPRESRFDAALEQAEKVPADRRDMYLSSAIMHASDHAPLEKVEAAVQRLQDAEVRRPILNWVYFRRGQNASHEGDFDEARRLAERIDALEARALLLLDIAERALRRADDKQRAEELLNAVVAAARKAPDNEAKARALLGVAHLYARFDYLRGLGALGEAASAVNKLNDPDLTSAVMRVAVQGKNFSTFAGWPMPSFTLESAFGELGAREFEATLAAANQLGDKYLRATAVLSLAGRCLADAERLDSLKKSAPARRGRKQ